MALLTHRVEGSDLQFVEITLAAGEAVVGEPGAMMFADEAVDMDTRMGDGDDASFFGRIAAGFKRAFTGENFFTSVFTNNTSRPLRVAFAAPSPGKIVAVDLASIGGTLICQRGAFPRRHSRSSSRCRLQEAFARWIVWRRGIRHATHYPAVERRSSTPAAHLRKSPCAPVNRSRWIRVAWPHCRHR